MKRTSGSCYVVRMTTETIERITPAKTALLVMDYQHGTLVVLC